MFCGGQTGVAMHGARTSASRFEKRGRENANASAALFRPWHRHPPSRTTMLHVKMWRMRPIHGRRRTLVGYPGYLLCLFLCLRDVRIAHRSCRLVRQYLASYLVGICRDRLPLVFGTIWAERPCAVVVLASSLLSLHLQLSSALARCSFIYGFPSLSLMVPHPGYLCAVPRQLHP